MGKKELICPEREDTGSKFLDKTSGTDVGGDVSLKKFTNSNRLRYGYRRLS
ncbi:MAG: hypothetical protein WC548_03140 [Candidatus Pacearchaeota archaeon]